MWMTLYDYGKQYSWPSVKHFRWMIWRLENTYKEQGKTCPFTNRYGKRILVDPDKFQAWLGTKEAHDIKFIMNQRDRQIKQERQQKASA